MAKTAFPTQAQIERSIRACRRQGLPVDNMRPFVGDRGFYLLPPGDGGPSDDSDLDVELEEFRKRHANG